MEKVQITILSKQDCKFCDEAKKIFERLEQEYLVEVIIKDLQSTEGQAVALREGIFFAPGILINGKLLAYGRPSERQIRKVLDQRNLNIS